MKNKAKAAFSWNLYDHLLVFVLPYGEAKGFFN